MNQGVSPGTGNIIKNETLHRARVAPDRKVGDLSDDEVKAIVRELRSYARAWLAGRRPPFLVYDKAACGDCGGAGRKTVNRNLSVSIPAGIEDGTRIRLGGEGEAGLRGGPSGDLYIFLSIRPHAFFQRDGADLYCRVPISMTTAALGGQFEVPTLAGDMTRVKVPEGTQAGKQFRLRGKGMPVMRSQSFGDTYIQVTVETPTNLTSKQKELLKEFEKAGKTSPESEGFFSKVKEMFGG